ncbi:MAG: hypothetical protein ABIO82_05655 [Ginsengibacter sp.]
MENNKQRIDIVNMVLEECIIAYPTSSFIISLYKQYQQRGSLSKKQLQGLHSKASKIEGIVPGKLGTLEAIIKKMPTRYKSDLPEPLPVFEKDKFAGEMIYSILEKYPGHKRVLYLKIKFENNDVLSAAENAELKKFKKILLLRLKKSR